ncbi:hypothetical protein Dimus_026206 [Dionaea muscipula]
MQRAAAASMDRLLYLCISIATVCFFSLSLTSEVYSATFRIGNNCRNTVWPGLLSGANSPQLPTTGFTLSPGRYRTIKIPKSWSGRIWGRTFCTHNASTHRFACLTADCGSGTVECSGKGALPPATLAEFTLNGAGGLDFYDVSLVDGFNLPMLVVARDGAGGDCSATGCLVDLNGACPLELRVESKHGNGSFGAVACKSACEAFGDPRYCCSEGYNTPETCPPTVYSANFKHACPRAYSYAYDDKTSTFTCASADYLIMFCPPPYSSDVLLGARRMAGELPLVNKTMMYFHGSSAATGPVLPHFIVSALTVLLAILDTS